MPYAAGGGNSGGAPTGGNLAASGNEGAFAAPQVAAVAASLERDPPTLGSELHRVGKQVREHLMELAGILADRGQGRIGQDLQLDVLLV